MAGLNTQPIFLKIDGERPRGESSGVCPDPVEWARTALGFEPDTVQAEILRSGARWLMLCCTRQYGKSTITAIKALHFALTHPKALILAAGPSERQSGEWLLKTREMLEMLEIKARRDSHHRLGLRLPNGARLIGLPEMPEKVRCFSSVSLIIIDEASYVKDQLYTALNPMLAVSRGGLWMMSTPGAQCGFFYEDWHRKDETIARFRVPATECERIPADFLAVQRIRLGEPEFRREYLCEFAASREQLFTRELIESCIDKEFKAWNHGQALWGN
jgi:hypothetical protein